MEYQEAVQEARTLVKRSEEDQWRLAELTWEQVEAGKSRRQWAQDVGLSPQYAASLYTVWERFGVQYLDTRPSFNDAFASVHTPGRYEETGATAGNARATMSRVIRNMPPEEKAEVVREALAEPDVAERVVRDTPTRTHLARAEHTVDREQQDTARERYELAEPRSHQIGAITDLEYALTQVRVKAEDAAAAADILAAHNWPDNSQERGAVLAQRAAAAVELVRAKLEGRTLDEELAALLEGGDA